MYINLAFFSGTPGAPELIVIFAVILLFFGPRRLPEIAKAIGKALTGLRRASQDFKDQIMGIDETPKDITDEVEYDDPYNRDENDLFDESYGEENETGEDEFSAADHIEKDLNKETVDAVSKKESDEEPDVKSNKAGDKKAGRKKATEKRSKQSPKG